MIKRWLILLLLLCNVSLVAVAASPQVSAVDLFPSPVCNSKSGTSKTDPNNTTVICQQNAQQKKSGENPVITALRVTITILSYIVGVSVVIILIVAGIGMVTSSGDPQSFKKARDSITYALIGVVLVVVAQVIVQFVLSKL